MLIFKGQRGMSLVQVMIALGLMSVIGLGVAELMVTSAKVNQRSDIKVSQLITINELQAVMSDQESCTDTVTDVVQTFDPAQALNNGWNIRFNIGGKVVQTGSQITNGLEISRLYFKRPNNQVLTSSIPNTVNYIGQINIEYQTADGVLGGQIKDKQIGTMFLTVRNGDNRVMACAKEPETTISKICQDLGGQYVNGQCQNYTFANCPGLSHGQSTTSNYTSGGDQCRKSEMCIDGQTVTTSDFCVSGTSNTTVVNPMPTCGPGYQWNSNTLSCQMMTCFTGETEVKMFDGKTQSITEVKKGDFVLGEDGAVNFVYDIEIVHLGKRKLYSLNGGPHFITEEHPLKTLDGWKSFNPIATIQEHSTLNRKHLFNLHPQPLVNNDTLLKYDYKQERLHYYTSIRDDVNLKVYNLRLMAAPGSPYDDTDDRSNTYFANGYLVHNK